ncbi:MAG: NPCBM/NEW2 domain-containing protein [Thermoguttaceae bacterium]|nr:NPCBM/NEW2 domain-containing protein [Thermoguttaceae bacterium]
MSIFKKSLVILIGVVFGIAFGGSLANAFETKNDKEAALKSRWIAAKFDGTAEEIVRPKSCLEVIQNNDPVFLDNRGGKKLQIAGQQYDRGLYCHAPSHINVFLPKPAKRFLGVVGIDTNAAQTSGGSGSVRFHLNVNGVEAFKTNVMRGAEKGIVADVDLGGASDFSLLIDDGGDGISCDQSDWADARVELEDGEILFLSDLELVSTETYDRILEVDFPFSFVYDGQSSRSFLKNWNVTREKSESVDGKETRTLTFTEPNGRLQVVCNVIDYVEYPFVEWTLNFKNLSQDADTPIIENIMPIDAIFGRDFFERRGFSGWDPECGDALRWNEQHEFKLHYSIGSPCRVDDYMPLVKQMDPGQKFDVATSGGRPTNSHLPYFNLESYQKGWIIVLGWSGQWSASFERQGELETHVTAGQELTHFKLHPGEEARSPIAVVAPWFRESWFDAQNVWRRWMIDYNVPRVPDKDNPDNKKGKVIETHLAACSSHFFAEMTQATTATQKEFIADYLKRGVQLDYWWMDAGWYPCEGNWGKTGTWEVDQTRFPGGFRPITDFGRERGVQTIVWFEPERVAGDTWLTNNHPEWIFGGSNGGLLNLGNKEAREWLTNHVDELLKKEGIDFYRQDYNIDPLSFWRAADEPDRQGISEIRYVEGYLAYWDALLERNPGLRIDSCASGGRRNDLETMRRAVPLLRSDYLLEPVGQQTHTYGIALWIPFFGSGTRAFHDYEIRSLFVPYFNFCYDVRDDEADWDVVRKNLNIWRESLASYFGADYYPLTSVSLDQDVWIGWQFNDEEKGEGVVQMFRRPDSKMIAGRFPLRGLDQSATYRLKDVDSGKTSEFSGKELTEKGILIEIDSAPKAAIIRYQKIK